MWWRLQQILITGASGLIGSVLAEKLGEQDFNYCPIDIRPAQGNLSLVSILDYDKLARIVADCSGVIHLAAISRVIWGEENPTLCRQVNMEGTNNIIKACLQSSNKPWLIYASSREVYGQQEEFPVREGCQLRPHNHYARSKLAAEQLVKQAQEAGLKSSILRFSNVFGGINDYFERVVPNFCMNALRNGVLNVEGENSMLDFTYVDDVVRGIIQAIRYLSQDQESLPDIHFTTCQPTSLLTLANLIVRLSNSSAEIVIKPLNSVYPSFFYGDYNRAASVLGWKPEYNLERGIEVYLSNIKQEKVKFYPSIMVAANENFKSNTRLSP